MAQARSKQHLDGQQPRTKQQHRVNRRGVISGQNAHAGLCGGNQLDVFGTGKHDNVLEFGDRCRCYFNGVPTYCVTDTKGFLSSVFGEDFMEHGTQHCGEEQNRSIFWNDNSRRLRVSDLEKFPFLILVSTGVDIYVT